MSVYVEFNQFRFSKAPYVMPQFEINGASNNVSTFLKLSNELIEEVARLGWELPDIDVEIRYDGKGKNVIKYCDKVSFEVDDNEGKDKIEIAYGKTYRMCKINEVRQELWQPRGFDRIQLDESFFERANKIISSVLNELKLRESAPGYEVKTEEGDENLLRICSSGEKPVPQDFPVIYARVEPNDAACALNSWGSDFDEDYAATMKYTLPGNGWRFCVPEGELTWNELPPHANNGFSYASADCDRIATGLNMGVTSECFPIEIQLKSLHDVFVYDRAPYSEGRKAASMEAEKTGNGNWKPGELENIIRSSLKTFIPAAEYKGDYKDPIYCIGRQLDETEARAMNGFVSVRLRDDVVTAELKDYETDKVVTLFQGEAKIYNMKTAIREARKVASILSKEAAIDPDVAEAIEKHHQRLSDERKIEQSVSVPSL